MPKVSFTPLEIPKLKQDKARFLMGFTKMVASGNDFVVIERSQNPTIKSPRILARRICARKFGVGADGLLLLEKSKIANVKMRIFNPDGSEAQMCGNGARCVASVIARSRRRRGNLKKCDCFAPSGLAMTIETRAGIIESRIDSNNTKIKLIDPEDIKLDIPIKVNKRNLKANFMDIGVPHAVIFVEGLNKIDVANLGRQIRYHKVFSPKGANVDFVEVLNNNSIKVRTYERGVEDETLACGTGAVASVLLYAIRYPCLSGRQALSAIRRVNVHTKGGEILKVYFEKIKNKFTPLDNKLSISENKYLTGFKNVWLEGKAKIVYKGCWCDE